jgi:hypothetical protein
MAKRIDFKGMFHATLSVTANRAGSPSHPPSILTPRLFF